MKDFFKNKKTLIAFLGIMGIILTTLGITVAWFSYARNGNKENTITAGGITFHYQEGSQGITLQDAMPMTDSQGKAQDKYFDFTITSKTSEGVVIPYYITARMIGNSNDMDDVVKVYLTDQSDQEIEEPRIYGELDQYEHDSIDLSNYTEKLIHEDRVPANESNYEQDYRLRIWIDENAEYIVQENGVDTYPYQGKTFTLKINVYSDGQLKKEAPGLPINTLYSKMTAYPQDGENIYRYIGENPDNYVTFAGDEAGWRIVGIFDGYLKLVKNDSIGNMKWNDVNNSLVDWEAPATLNSELNNSKYAFYNSGYVQPYNWCIGAGNARITSTYAQDCAVLTTRTMKVGLVSMYDVSQAAWLRNTPGLNYAWAITQDNQCGSTSYGKCAAVYRNGSMSGDLIYSREYQVYPAVYLKQDLTVTGEGTSDSPYDFHKNENVITFDVNGGDALPADKLISVISAGDSYGRLPIPTRTNFAFDGWYTESNVKVSKNDVPTDDITLYAHWSWNGVCSDIENQVLLENGTTNTEQTMTVECPGKYKLEVWGAQGGDATCGSRPGGYGGYSVGVSELAPGTKLYINVGGTGSMATLDNTPVSGGYNGGGNSRYSDGRGSNGECFGSGGGATHIALDSGQLKNLSSHATDGRIIIAAGGGGGASYYYSYGNYRCYGSGGHGGGINGTDAYDYARNSCGASNSIGGYGGLQNLDNRTVNGLVSGTFGQGGYIDTYGGTGGGGGYYGGYSSSHLGAGGGSGYIASSNLISANDITKHMYCYNCTTSPSTSSDTYTISDGTSSCHNSVATADCAKEGNGYVRITYLGTN